MAKRPIFIPLVAQNPYFKELPIDFNWYPGFAKTQAQKSIRSLHQGAAIKGIHPVLEISSKSENSLGISLSAFNLMLKHNGVYLSVECAFQGSKVFRFGGPYNDLYNSTSIEAKKDKRIRESGELIGFTYFGEEFPTNPLTAFYNWVYINALSQNPNLAEKLFGFEGFSDIAFNPEHSINCQARSAALFVALSKSTGIDIFQLVNDKEYYINLISTKDNHKNKNRENPLQLTFLE